MNRKSLLFAVMFGVAVFASGSNAWSAKRNVTTTITVKGMHCQACAKKITTLLNKVPGVAASQADAKKEVAVIIPKQGNKLPSPRAQWEAVEKAGYKPIRLAGPFGTYTKKPKF